MQPADPVAAVQNALQAAFNSHNPLPAAPLASEVFGHREALALPPLSADPMDRMPLPRFASLRRQDDGLATEKPTASEKDLEETSPTQ